MKIFLVLTFLPVLTVASIGYDIILVDPDLAKELGFVITISKEEPYFRVKVAYPNVIDDAWQAETAVISDALLPNEARFFVPIDLNVEKPSPIRFTLTKAPSFLDASVGVHYVCISDDIEVCDKGATATYHIESIRDHIDAVEP